MRELNERDVNILLRGVLDDRLLDLYLILKPYDTQSLERVSALFGMEKVKVLVEAGMANIRSSGSQGRPAIFLASPDLVLQRTLLGLARSIVATHERISDAHDRARGTRPSPDLVLGGTMDQLVRILSVPSEINELIRVLSKSAQRDWLTLDGLPYRGPGNLLGEDFDLPADPAKLRSIFHAQCIADPSALEVCDLIAQSGGQVRLLSNVGMRMRLADEAIALLSLSMNEPGVLLVQSSVIVGALREYFELLWSRATPYRTPFSADGPLSSTQLRILNLLVQGLSDNEISEQVGLSISTVRRHITTVREELGAETRFAAGVIAFQQGLVG
ncbi:helix-turn-helix transcriptional regulator [Actinomadura roseirufa]|uniref:helix-turn-helix transcriptional regulator n=1 Tax=Actinomadura roseirufa TaxID=2094049 RepID=UPI00104157F0|nr:LuxR C-terminal-related transcriptional regulator [Actinomadura roseirufa]